MARKRRFSASPQSDECEKQQRNPPAVSSLCRWTESKLPIPILSPSSPFLFIFRLFRRRYYTQRRVAGEHERIYNGPGSSTTGNRRFSSAPRLRRESVPEPINATLQGVWRLFEDMREESTSQPPDFTASFS